jgi:pyruvate,orthophosphate dikinase
VEQARGKRFGDVANPLLLSVRSGAKFSMPGMMDTILDLGLTDMTVEGLAAASGSVRFAYDSYRRLIQLYGKVVLGAPGELFEEALTAAKTRHGIADDTGLDAAELCQVTATFKAIVREQTGAAFPQKQLAQLRGAIGAVFRSWQTPRAQHYRHENHIADDLGTAMNVQAMVYGNMGEDCTTGVAFARDLATGDRLWWLEMRPSASRGAQVGLVEAPEDRHGTYRPRTTPRFRASGSWHSLADALVRSRPIDVRHVLAERADELSLAEDEQVVQAFAAHAP